MAKKFGKFLLASAAIGTAVAAYRFLQKKDSLPTPDESDEDYDDFSESLDEEPDTPSFDDAPRAPETAPIETEPVTEDDETAVEAVVENVAYGESGAPVDTDSDNVAKQAADAMDMDAELDADTDSVVETVDESVVDVDTEALAETDAENVADAVDKNVSDAGDETVAEAAIADDGNADTMVADENVTDVDTDAYTETVANFGDETTAEIESTPVPDTKAEANPPSQIAPVHIAEASISEAPESLPEEDDDFEVEIINTDRTVASPQIEEEVANLSESDAEELVVEVVEDAFSPLSEQMTVEETVEEFFNDEDEEP